MGWRTDKALTVAQLSNNMSASLVPDTAYWQAYAYQQIKNMLTGMNNRIPLDSDFTDIATALADSDVAAYGALRVTKTHSIDAVLLDIPSSNFSLIGDGFGNAKIDSTKTSGSGGPILRVNNKDVVYITGLEIDGNAVNNGFMGEGDMAIDVRNSDYVVITDCYLHNVGGDGIYLSNCDNIIISNCIIEIPAVNDSTPLVGRNGIAVVEGSNILISNNIILNAGVAGIDIEPNPGLTAEHITITGNQVYNVSNVATDDGIGISINGSSAGATCQNVEVIGNRVESCNQEGIRSDVTTDVSIVGNGVSNCGASGIDITAGNLDVLVEGNKSYSNTSSGIEIHGSASNVHVTGNICQKNGVHGILFGGSGGSEITFSSCRNNTCFNNSQTTDNSSDGILINFSDDMFIQGNYSYDTGGAKNQRYGIRVANCDSVSIIGNHATGNQTSELSYTSNTVQMIAHNHVGANVGDFNHSDYRALASADMQFKLADSAGAKSLKVLDSSGGQMFKITSDGVILIGNASAVGTAVLQLSSLTSTQRDALTEVHGMIIYNETSNLVEAYSNSAWREIGDIT